MNDKGKVRNVYKKLIKASLVVLICFSIGILGYFTYYFKKNIYPEYDNVNSLLSHADPAHKDLPETVERMLNLSLDCDDLYLKGQPDKACKERKNGIVNHLIVKKRDERSLNFNIRRLLISTFVINHLKDKDKNTLISDLSYLGIDKEGNSIIGFNEYAQIFYHKSLTDLSLDEIATIIAVEKSPSFYLDQPDLLHQRKQHLLDKYNEYSRTTIKVLQR